MKKQIFYGACMLSMLVAAGCSSDEMTGNNDIAGKQIAIDATIEGGASTRLAYDDQGETNGLKVAWSTTEKFTICDGKGNEDLFSKKTDGNTFVGYAPSTADKYYCVYPADDYNIFGATVNVDLSADQVATTAENGIKEFMVAEATDLTAQLNFAHKLSVLKLNLTLSGLTAGTVSKVTVSGLHNMASYDLSKAAYTYNDDGKGAITATNTTAGFAIAADGKMASAYVAVFPEDVVANQVTITATVGSDNYAYTMTTGNTLPVGKVVPVTATLTKAVSKNFKSAYTATDFFKWDAQTSVLGTTPDAGTSSSATTELFKSCLTASQMVAYLKAGCYWDDGTVTTANTGLQTFSAPTSGSSDGTQIKTDSHKGLWLKKRANIDGFDNETDLTYIADSEETGFHKITAENAASIRTSDEYFFLPAAGRYDEGFEDVDTYGYYWSSTPEDEDSFAYYLDFGEGYAGVDSDVRGYGYLPMIAE